jgi:hypothetical protein
MMKHLQAALKDETTTQPHQLDPQSRKARKFLRAKEQASKGTSEYSSFKYIQNIRHSLRQ